MDITAIRGAAEPVSKTLQVAKTNADQLGKALGVAREQFGIDITDKAAVEGLLDRMVVAGRLGNAELENLPDIFARIGGRAKAANFTLDQTLALTEAFSQSEPQAERLATLVNSTLRMFTSGRYIRMAQEGTGVNFFDAKGARRDPLEIIRDIRTEYLKLKTDSQKVNFLTAAFGKMDEDTYKGMDKALQEGTLEKIDEFNRELRNATGTVDRDLGTAMDNAVTQANRLKGAFHEAIEDGVMRPLDNAFTNVVGFMMDSKEQGGLGLSGGSMLKIGGGALSAALLGGMAIRLTRGLRGGGGLLGIGSNLATAKAMEHAAGVQPVFVVNMPGGGLGGGTLPGLGGLGGLGGEAAGAAGALGKFAQAANIAAAAVTAFSAGWSLGTAMREAYLQTEAGQKFDHAGGQVIATVLSWFGNEEAQYARDHDDENVIGELVARFQAWHGNKEAIEALEINRQMEAERQRSQAVLDGTSQQAAEAVKASGDAAAQSISAAKIGGEIKVMVSAPATLNVSTTAVGTPQTKLNVGRTNTGAQ
ncbi:phage tail tape measure protein [Eikenella sp. S3360]|uniref:Phage tail tape measure protein n=1 Tax=Eikenella glucosivorans TaxID=2766967 RepID=A0ABS0N7U2_9NEIS|nr:phage tail tape measure protein [Eikenella glucosivorans]